MKIIKYLIQFFIICIFYVIFKIIGVKLSSYDTEVVTEHNFGNIDRNKIQQKSVNEALKMSLDILKNV